MNVNAFSNLEIYRTTPFSGLTDENSLRKAMLTAPAQMTSMVSFLLGTKDNGSFLDLISNGIGHVKEIESNEYRWKVMIDGDRAINIVKAAGLNEEGTHETCTATRYYGHNQSPITIWTAEQYFGPQAIIIDRGFIVVMR